MPIDNKFSAIYCALLIANCYKTDKAFFYFVAVF